MNLMQTIEANWQIFAVVLVIAVLLLIWLLGRATRRKPRERRPDVLDEGAAPAQRNQALIDAPPAAAVAAPIVAPPPVAPPVVTPPAAAGTFAGLGEAIATGAQAEVRATTEPDAGAPEANAAPAASDAASQDDLRRIKGVGPKLVALLHGLGVTRFDQIAGWTEADLDDLDTKLGAFAGRPRRDAWVEQARLLSSGDTAGYEARFGKL